MKFYERCESSDLQKIGAAIAEANPHTFGTWGGWGEPPKLRTLCFTMGFSSNAVHLWSNLEASLVVYHSVCNSKTIKVILSAINRAAYCEQKTHFNGYNRLRIAWDIQCVQKRTHRRVRFLWGYCNCQRKPAALAPRSFPLTRSQCRKIVPAPFFFFCRNPNLV